MSEEIDAEGFLRCLSKLEQIEASREERGIPLSPEKRNEFKQLRDSINYWLAKARWDKKTIVEKLNELYADRTENGERTRKRLEKSFDNLLDSLGLNRENPEGEIEPDA